MKPEVYDYFLQKILSDKTYLNSYDKELTKKVLLEEYIELYDTNIKFKNKINKIVFPQVRKQIFITIQDYQRRMKDIPKLVDFIKNISYMYETGNWVIETGKKEDEASFNVHIHLIVKIKDNIKNHKRDLNAAWRRRFPTDLNDKDFYHVKQWRKSKDMPPYKDWYEERLMYIDNTKKESHANTIDLELGGKF